MIEQIKKIFTSKEVNALNTELTALKADKANWLAEAEKYEALKADRINNDQLQADNVSLVNENQAYKEKVDSHNMIVNQLRDSQVKELTELKADNESATAKLKADYELQISNLKSKVEQEAKSSESKAISTLAKIGVPTDELPQVTNQNASSVLDAMSGLSSAQVSEYFSKNKAAIFAELKKQKSAGK